MDASLASNRLADAEQALAEAGEDDPALAAADGLFLRAVERTIEAHAAFQRAAGRGRVPYSLRTLLSGTAADADRVASWDFAAPTAPPVPL